MSNRSCLAIAISMLAAGCGRVGGTPPATPPLDAAAGNADDAAVPDATAAPLDAALDAAPDPADDATVDAPPDAPPALEITVEPQIGWSHQTGPVTLGAAPHRLCFLVGVSGDFKDTADVRIFIQDGAWIIDGTAPAALGAVARCITWSAANGLAADEVYGWSSGQVTADLGAEADRLCVLTRMAGMFRSGGDMVRVTTSGGSWRLDGAAVTAGVIAGARCLTWPAGTSISYGDEATWVNPGAARDLGAEGKRACALTLVTGGFAGFGENVSVRGEAGRWLLTGDGQQIGVAARARCLTWL